jgi:hypothetical protein
MKRFKIISGGHVYLPREIEQRWGTHFATLEDHGDYLVLRPAADEASVPKDLEEHWPEDGLPESARRRSTGAGF